MFCYDPFCLYDTETLLSPCMLVSGNKGYGKSAFVKAYLHRQAMAGKWLAILDPKGEYLDLAARDRLSVLSPAARRPGTAQPPRCRDRHLPGTGTEDVRGRRIGVVVALAESATGRPVSSRRTVGRHRPRSWSSNAEAIGVFARCRRCAT